MSPSYTSLHPFAAFFGDCGLGSDPNSTAPCSGTYSSAAEVAQQTSSVLSSGKSQVIAVGAVLLVLAAVLVLIRVFVGATSGRRSKGKESEQLTCERCGSPIPPDDEFPTNHGDLCGDCFFDTADGVLTLAPGQAMCMACGVVVEMADGERWDGCPACGFDGSEGDEAMGVCSVCGVESDELVGDLFPACPDCAADSEERAIADDTSDGPSDEETFGGNPDGIGGGGVRA